VESSQELKYVCIRWLSVDPLADKYPGWSPYNYCLNNPLKYVDPDGKDVHIKISNKTNHPVDINKIASIIKSQFEQAGVKDVNVYTGIWGKIKYAFKSLTGGKNMRTVVLDSWDVSGADRGLSNGKINLGGFVKDNEKDLNTAVANTGSHELGHNLAELKDARDENGNNVGKSNPHSHIFVINC
jgi:hypothetical protein